MLVISDAGFPVPPGVPRIDLAVTPGVPPFLCVVEAVASELEAEGLIIATELVASDTSLPADIQACFPHVRLESMSHEQFKSLSARAPWCARANAYPTLTSSSSAASPINLWGPSTIN
jgi:D-ribose pyranase